MNVVSSIILWFNLVTPFICVFFFPHRYTLINDVSQLERFLNPEDANSVIELSKVVNFLAEKLRTLCCLEDMVNIIQNPDEGEMFCMELTSFLRELCIWTFASFKIQCINFLISTDCPYACLMEGPPLIRLSSRMNRLKLINFLVSECEAALMTKYENQLQKSSIAVWKNCKTTFECQVFLIKIVIEFSLGWNSNCRTTQVRTCYSWLWQTSFRHNLSKVVQQTGFED